MQRSMLGITLRDRVANTDIRERIKVVDAVAKIATLKWNQAVQMPEIQDNRWTRKLVQWRPRQEAYRSRGRPATKWTDGFKRIA